MSPPFLFFVVPYRQLSDWQPNDGKLLALIVVAQVIWIVGAVMVGHLAHEKFRQITNRAEWQFGQPRPIPPVASHPSETQ